MALSKRGLYWHFEFVVGGERYRGSTGETNKAKALEYEARERTKAIDARRAGLNGRKSTTLGEAVKQWLENVAALKKDYRNNQSKARKLFGAELDRETGLDVPGKRWGLSRDLDLSKIDAATLMELKEARAQEDCSPATINRELALISAVLTYAHKKGYNAPILRITEFYEDEDDGKLRWLTLDEEAKLFAALQERRNDPRAVYAQAHYDLAVLLLDTGARLMEMASLRWDSVDVEQGLVRINRTKVGNSSTLKVPARSIEILRRRKDEAKTSYVFPKVEEGDEVNRSLGHCVKGIRTAIDAAGLNDDPVTVKRDGKVTIHTFRHTFASRLVQAGVPLYHVQALLGHSSPLMTQRYAKLRVEAASTAAAAVLDTLHQAPPTTPNVIPFPAAA